MTPNRRRRHAATAADDRWRLLGELLQARRVELGYRDRTAFARARLPLTESGKANTRLPADIEMNYRPGTYPAGRLRDFARVYQVTYDSMAAVLKGEAGKLTPAEPAPPPAPGAASTPPASAHPAADAARNLTSRIEQLAAASGDPADRETLAGYVDRALRRVQIEVEELLADIRSAA